MTCYHPLKGYRSKDRNPDTGKRSIVVVRRDAHVDCPIELPCGQCIGCRLERSRIWAIRCVHEASLYDHNSFITLTYSDQNLPQYNSLQVSDFQKFMKRLRKAHPNQKIRFFHCGEYGDRFQRPHYHACLFNIDFPDKKHWKTINDQKLYTSEKLQSLWSLGHTSVGTVTFESAAYVARYVTKKITGPLAEGHYMEIDRSTGEILSERVPEYTTMSRRPGIAKAWFDKYYTDVYPSDFITLRGKKLSPPKFYNSQYELLYPHEYQKIKARRKTLANKHADNNTVDRLAVREFLQHERFNKLRRSYESNET